MSTSIGAQTIRGLVDQWLAQGRRVLGPKAVKPGTVLYGELASSAELLLLPDTRPANSIKEAVFPRHEALYRYRLEGKQVQLRDGFEWDGWATATLRCLGCGACAYGCPTCHCFDVVDEGHAAGGARVRNWDACQFAMFTLHASGHNPRASQWQRQRQRIYHKFHIYPEKFAATLCTGCGNCARNCPVGLGVLPVLRAIRLAAGLAPRGASPAAKRNGENV